MKLIPVTVEKDGARRPPCGWLLPPKARLAVVALEANETTQNEAALIAENSGCFDFLVAEPDLYSDADVLPGRSNPDFGRSLPDVQTG